MCGKSTLIIENNSHVIYHRDTVADFTFGLLSRASHVIDFIDSELHSAYEISLSHFLFLSFFFFF
jgi:hypothetical protein